MGEEAGVRVAAIQIEKDFFDVVPFNDNFSILRKFHPKQNSDYCGTSHEEEVGKHINNFTAKLKMDYCSPGKCPGIIDVLVLLDESAYDFLNAPGNPWNFSSAPGLGQILYISIGLIATNLAFFNSDVPSRINFKVIDVSGFNYQSNADLNVIELTSFGAPLRGNNDLVLMLMQDVDPSNFRTLGKAQPKCLLQLTISNV